VAVVDPVGISAGSAVYTVLAVALETYRRGFVVRQH
jgi:hypothetical protein